MTEVYSILNQAPPGENNGWIIGLAVFWGAVFLILLFGLVKKLMKPKGSGGKIVGNILAMVFIIVASVVFAISMWGEKLLYDEYMEAWESGAYSVESGEPSRLEIYTSEDGDGNTVYEVSFWVNGKYFDSYYAYGEGNFSRSDVKLIDSSEVFEVKYIVDEFDENVILSLSVGEKTD